MANVGGRLQAQFMARIRGRDPDRCLVVPVDVGKSAAMALIADHSSAASPITSGAASRSGSRAPTGHAPADRPRRIGRRQCTAGNTAMSLDSR